MGHGHFNERAHNRVTKTELAEKQAERETKKHANAKQSTVCGQNQCRREPATQRERTRRAEKYFD